MNSQEILSTKKEFECGSCEQTNQARPRKCDSGPHFAKYECVACGRFHSWSAKPDELKTHKTRSAKHSDLVRKFGSGFCEMCLRSESELRKQDTLVGHHVKEHHDGGDASRVNIWIVCTACHSQIHHVRTYFGKNKRDE